MTTIFSATVVLLLAVMFLIAGVMAAGRVIAIWKVGTSSCGEKRR